jgi:TPR repeat protein
LDSRLHLPANTVLDRNYRIERVLGSGGFGITYEAEDINLNAAVALKEYYPFDFGERDSTMSVKPKSVRHKETFDWGRASFLQEARMLARFRHPSIVRVSRVFEANSTAYMVMDFEPGQSFDAWLKSLGRPPSQEELDRIAAPLLDALEMMHAQNFLHRDIAPDNVIVRADGTPVLLDFGSARRAVGERSRALTGIVKAGYSPPEQYATDSRQQGPWTDLYALGGVLYRAVTGQPPEEATLRLVDDHMRAAAAAAKGQYRRNFLAAIDACLKVKHSERPRSVAQLRPMLLAQGPQSTPAARPLPATRKLEQHMSAVVASTIASPARRWMTGIAILVLLVGIYGGFRYASWYGDRRSQLEADAKREQTERQASEKRAANERARQQAEWQAVEKRIAEEQARLEAEAKRKTELSAEEKARRTEEARREFQEGERYYYGRDVPQDYAKAHGFYEKAAAAGHTLSMVTLGWLYKQGIGVAQDYRRAREWFEKASAAGNGNGMCRLGELYEGGLGVAQDYGVAREWYEKAAGTGDSDAMVNLGWLYESGLGVSQDHVKARQWYENAVADSNLKPAANLAAMLDEAKGGPADFRRAARLLLDGAKGDSELILANLRGDMKKWHQRTRIELKRELVRLGHLKGAIDDKWDDGARAALAKYLASKT